MSSFLHPSFLWGLAGLAIPIAIHLLSRKEGKIIKVGSLRHLRTSESPTFKSIKINELVLLAVRCLLLIAMVLFISELIFPNWWTKEDKKWVLVDPVVEIDASTKKVLDSLVEDGYELRSLQKGFPEIENVDVDIESDYWSLVAELENKSNTEVLVFSGDRLEDFKGKRIFLPANVKWVSAPVSENEFLATATKLNAQEVLIRKGKANPSATSFEFVKQSILPDDQYAQLDGDSVLISNPDTLFIKIVADEKFAYDKQILMASLQAIDQSTAMVLDVQSGNLDQKVDWLIWLSENEPPNTSKCISYQAGDMAPFFRQVSKTHWQLTKRLNQEVASNNQLTTMLFDLLIPITMRETTSLNDRRVMPPHMLWSNTSKSGEVQKAQASSNQQFLFLIVILLFVIERGMAYAKKL